LVIFSLLAVSPAVIANDMTRLQHYHSDTASWYNDKFIFTLLCLLGHLSGRVLDDIHGLKLVDVSLKLGVTIKVDLCEVSDTQPRVESKIGDAI
jgi:hypothetical protein